LDVVNSTGHPVATLVDDRMLSPGMQRFAWRGRNALGRVFPNGDYRPEVILDAQHRRLLLARSIELDTTPPRLVRDSARADGRGLLVRYRFDEPAHALLLVDGRRAELTRSASPSGRLNWNGTFADGRHARRGRLRVSVAGIDLAGNRSAPSRAIDVRLG
jgi:hypothetical protein